MSANRADFPVAAMARVLGVSKAGYYAGARREPSARAMVDAALLKRIHTVHLNSHQTYGAPRIHADLRKHGERHSRKRIARLMRKAGLVGASHRAVVPWRRGAIRRCVRLPISSTATIVAEAPNRLWVADITFVPTAAGFFYPAVVLNGLSRRIVGWAMHGQSPALGVGARRPGEGLRSCWRSPCGPPQPRALPGPGRSSHAVSPHGHPSGEAAAS